MVKHGVIHVVQASYGDAMVFEFSPDDSNVAYKYMLIDGGPASNERYYAPPEVGRPKHNLFHLLNVLSDSHVALHKLTTIDTLVLTHDDEDHKQGIQALFASLLKTTKPSGQADNDFNCWIEGDKKMTSGEPPVLHIWYNSLKNVGIAQKFKKAAPNWFDNQLTAYVGVVKSPTKFNDDLKVNTGKVALAMVDSVSTSGQHVVKDQFTFDFIGPVWETLNKAKLRGILGQVDSLKDPKYVFTEQMVAKTEGLSGKTLLFLEKLAVTTSVKKSKDGSLKNQSSIAFAAEDGDSKILLLGDGVASMFWDRYIKVRKETKFAPYTVMKIMHHGSLHNNYWNRNKKRETEEEGIAPIKDVDMDPFLRSTTFFFAKVPAKKYIISASSFDVHPNPHASTLLGIITAAQENNTNVNIYLTNHLSPWIAGAIAEWYFANKKKQDQVVPNTTFLFLASKSHYGTVAVYDHEADSADWVKTEVKDMWSSYSDLLGKRNKVIADYIREQEDKYPQDATQVQPPRKIRKVVHKKFANLVLFERSAISMEVSADATPNVSSTKPQPVAGAERRSPGSRHVSSALTGTSAHMDHSELTSHEWFDTTTLPDIDSTFKYLVEHGSIDASKLDSFKQELAHNGGFKLGALALLFLGTKESEKLLASLPCNLDNSGQYLDGDDSPYLWVATDFSAKVVDPEETGMFGWNGIYSITFNAKPEKPSSPWTLPLNNGKGTHHFAVDGSLNFVILWPRYVKGIASVAFKGELKTTSKSYHAIAELTVMSDQYPKYRMKLSSPQYDVDTFKISLLDLALVFDTHVDFKSSLLKVVIPDLESALNDVVDMTLGGAGFTLEKVMSKLIVDEIFAEKSVAEITGSKDWNPFKSEHFKLNPTVLRVVVDNAYSDSSRQITVDLDGNMNISLSSEGSDPEVIPFRLSAQHTVNQFMLYEVSLYPGTDDSLSIGHLLRILGISSALDLEESFPGVSNLSNALSISHVTVGWLGSATPDYLKFTIALEDWVLSKDLVEVNTIHVDVEVSGLSSKSPMHLALRGWGVITISDIPVEAFFSFIKNDQESGKDLVSIQIGSQQRPIPLGTIVSHFLGESTQILPQTLSSLLKETTIDSLIIQGERSGSSGWSVTRIRIAMSIQSQINVFSDIELGYPTLVVEVAHPFDQKARTVYAAINASIIIGDIICSTEIIVASAGDSMLSMSLQSDNPPVSIEGVVSHFYPDYGNVKLPAGLAFLAGIGIHQASLTLEISNGKFTMTELSLSAISTSSLKLWNEITLQNICLQFSRSRDTNQTLIEFDAMLLLNQEGTEFIGITLHYGGPTVTPANVADVDEERTLVAPVGSKGVWSANAEYQGRISAIDVLSSVSGIDLHQALKDLDIAAFTDALNLVITGLQVKLDHSAESSSFSLDAKTEWLCFSHLRFACSKATQWTYSFGFDIDTGRDYGSVIPFIDKIKEFISLEDMSVSIFNGELDLGSLRPTHAKLRKEHARGVSLAVAAKFVLGKELKKVGEMTNTSEVYIIGIVSKDSFTLSATLTGNMSLFRGSMVVTDVSAIVECKSEDKWLPIIGVRGSATLDFGKSISDNPIDASMTIFIKTSELALGLRMEVKAWRSMFGITGMDFEDLFLQAAFPPEQFPVPSEFTISGSIKLDINNSDIKGDVTVHVLEEDLTSSYAEGTIKGLSLSHIIKVFTDVDFGPPGYLDSGFGPLTLMIVPKDMIDRRGQALKQQFKMSGSMKLPIIRFEADIDIDISPERLHVDGNLTPISIPYVSDKLFSILASPHEDGVSPLVRKGPSIRIHIGDEDKPIDAKVSGMISFLGMSNEINITITETGLKFLLAQDVWTKRGSFNGELNSTHLKVHADYEFALNIVMPEFSLDGIQFKSFQIFDFSGKLDVEVVWHNIAWNLVISGHFELFGLRFDKTLSVGADFEDLAAIGKKIADFIKSTFGIDLVAGLKRLGEDISKALTILKDFGLSVAHRVKILVDSCGKALAPVLDVAKKLFGLVWNEVGVVLRELGKTAEVAAKVLKEIGSKAYDVAVAVGKAFGPTVKKLCAKILQEAGHVVTEISDFFRTTFGDAAHEIVDLLTEIGYGSFAIVNGVGDAFKTSVEEIFRMVVGVKKKKTRSQIQEQLLLSLMIAANSLLSNRIAIKSEHDLEVLIQQHATERFRHMFGYDFDGPNSKPVASINSKAIKGGSFMAVYQDGQKNHALENANTMIGQLNLEPWMMDKAKSDIIDEIDVFLGLIPANDWKSTTISKGYLPDDTNKNPVHVDGIVIFANGAILEDDIRVTQTIFLYIGVFYEVVPETKLVRHSLSVGAYNAVPLLNQAKTPIDDSSLSRVLLFYGAESFKKQHGTSDQWAAPEITGTEKGIIGSLACFEDGNIKKLESLITTTIIGKTALPSWSTSNIETDLASQFKSIIGSSTTNSWATTKIDATYRPPQAMQNPVASKAVIIWYKAKKTTSQNVNVSLVYIFFYGVYYAVMNPRAVLRNDLIRALSLNLIETMKEEHSSFEFNLDNLKIHVERYAREEFYKTHEFDFLDEYSTPNDRHGEEPMHAVRLFQEFEGIPQTKDLDDWVGKIIKLDAFPLFKQDSSIREDFRTQSRYVTDRGIGFSLNSWSVIPVNNRYNHPSNPEANIRSSGIMIYSNGEFTAQNDTVKIAFVYYLGLFYVGDVIDW